MENKQEALLAALQGSLEDYTSYPFWSWNNKLDAHELIRQIHEFKDLSIDGFIIHARTGLKEEYLGEKWFSLVKTCIDEARKLSMKIWIYDENGWPSGFAGGTLLRGENYVQYVRRTVCDSFDRSAVAVFSFANGKAKRLHPGDRADAYHCLYVEDHPCFVDILNPDVTDQFIRATHEEYYKRFADAFGKEIRGFFTDEPQYFRNGVPFSRVVPAQYAAAYGEDVFDGLIWLFEDGEGAAEFRYKFYSLLNALYTQNFYKRIYDWCEAHHCHLTGHSIDETRLFGQILCCGGVMPSYEYEHVPAIDWLGRRIGNAVAPRQVSSVAAQLNRREVLTETYACSGWDATPRELRRIAEFQFAGGVNTICQHLSAYSLKGQAKGDHPPFFSRHNAWIKDSKEYNNYFKRLSFILRNTCEMCRTLVIHPIRAAYASYLDRGIGSEDARGLERQEKQFADLVERLTEAGIMFHFGDETILKRHAHVADGKFIVGSCVYDFIVLPEMDNVDKETLGLIESFTASGGKLCMFGAAPSYVSGKKATVALRGNFSFDDLPGYMEFFESSRPGVVLRRCKGEIGEFLYVVNTSDASVELAPVRAFCRLDLERVAIEPVGGKITLSPYESAVLIFGASVRAQPARVYLRDVTGMFSFVRADNNNLTLDFVSISYDGERFELPAYVQEVNERLIKSGYSGDLWVKYTFDAKYVPNDARLLFETMNYQSLTLNGKPLRGRGSAFDVFYEEAEIADIIQAGTNELIGRIRYFQRPSVKPALYGDVTAETLSNCVVIDTEIESVYVQGQFFVDADRAIIAPGNVEGTYKLQEKGFPNFAGTAVFIGYVETNHTDADLVLQGRYMTARVRVNGQDAGLVCLTERISLTGLLQKGKNCIEIAVTSSMRNMFGPHHFALDPEPLSVGHYAFEFRGGWENGTCKDFTPEYSLVDFGLQTIALAEKSE